MAMTENQKAQKERARSDSISNGSGHGMEDRYVNENKNLDRAFNQSDAEFRAGKLTEDQYHAKQKAQENEYNNKIKDIPQSKRDEYADRMTQKSRGK